jgi:transposase
LPLTTAADHAHCDRHRWLWELLEPLLLTPQRRSRYLGRKRLDDRAVLHGILYVLHSGIAWQNLLSNSATGSG